MKSSSVETGTVKENVLESDFVSLCDGTTRRRSLADLISIQNKCTDNYIYFPDNYNHRISFFCWNVLHVTW